MRGVPAILRGIQDSSFPIFFLRNAYFLEHGVLRFLLRRRCSLRLEYGLEVQSMFGLVVVGRHLTVPPGPVHGIDVWVEEYLIEMPYHDGKGCEYGFIEVNGGGYVQPPAREMISDQ